MNTLKTIEFRFLLVPFATTKFKVKGVGRKSIISSDLK